MKLFTSTIQLDRACQSRHPLFKPAPACILARWACKLSYRHGDGRKTNFTSQFHTNHVLRASVCIRKNNLFSIISTMSSTGCETSTTSTFSSGRGLSNVASCDRRRAGFMKWPRRKRILSAKISSVPSSSMNCKFASRHRSLRGNRPSKLSPKRVRSSSDAPERRIRR